MSEKINTWAIAEEIENAFGWNGDPCLEEASFYYDSIDGSEDDDAELKISITGEIEHPMSGYNESFNTAVDVELEGTIKPDGTISISGTYKMEVGPASTDESDNLIKNHSWSETGEEETTNWTADSADDFIEGLKEIPQ